MHCRGCRPPNNLLLWPRNSRGRVGAESSLTVQSRGWKVSLYQILALGGKSIGELKSQTPQIIDPLIQFVLSSLV